MAARDAPVKLRDGVCGLTMPVPVVKLLEVSCLGLLDLVALTSTIFLILGSPRLPWDIAQKECKRVT